jgi:hypothetical protein
MFTKAFHPGTMGVMLDCKIIKRHDDDTVTVKFDEPFPATTKYTFRIPSSHLQENNK